MADNVDSIVLPEPRRGTAGFAARQPSPGNVAPRARRSKRGSRRPALVWTVHKWLGWSLGLVFALIGLTGSVLVVKDLVDARLAPACYAGGGTPAVLPSVADVLRAAYAGTPLTDVDTVLLPERPGDPWVLRAERGDEDVEVFVRADAGAVLCARVWEDSAIGLVERFHTSLLIPFEARHGTVALLAVGDLVLVLAGLLLYLRDRRATRRPRWPRVHTWIGLAAVSLLSVPLVTGIAMAVPDLARGVLASALPFSPPQARIRPVRLTAPPVGPDAAITAALAAVPGAKARAVVLPAVKGAPYRVFVRPPGDSRTRSGGSATVLVGPERAEVLAVNNPVTGPMGDRVFASRFPLHTGEMWYTPGRVVALASGLAPAALLATAALAWLARRRRRRLVAERAAGTQPA